jgi:5-methyltetrahydropteroyltriglutamate--homocysteine methyltransferase
VESLARRQAARRKSPGPGRRQPTNVVEHPEVVADRILNFARVVGRENVIAGTDCGLGGRIHPQLVWAKLAALVEGAKLATKELYGS